MRCMKGCTRHAVGIVGTNQENARRTKGYTQKKRSSLLHLLLGMCHLVGEEGTRGGYGESDGNDGLSGKHAHVRNGGQRKTRSTRA